MEQRKVSVEELDSVPLDHVWVVWLFVILSVIKWFITYLILLNTKRDKGYRSIYCHTTRQLLSPGLETPQFIMKTPLSKKCFLVFKALYKNDIKFTLYLIFGAWNIWTAQFRLKFDYEIQYTPCLPAHDNDSFFPFLNLFILSIQRTLTLNLHPAYNLIFVLSCCESRCHSYLYWPIRLGEAGDVALVRHEGRGSEGFLEHVFKHAAKELFGLDVHEITYKHLRWDTRRTLTLILWNIL